MLLVSKSTFAGDSSIIVPFYGWQIPYFLANLAPNLTCLARMSSHDTSPFSSDSKGTREDMCSDLLKFQISWKWAAAKRPTGCIHNMPRTRTCIYIYIHTYMDIETERERERESERARERERERETDRERERETDREREREREYCI